MDAQLTTDGGSRVRRWLGPWLILIALGVAVATGYGIMRLNDYAAERGELKALLSRIETDSRHQSALEWQRLPSEPVGPPVPRARAA
jgi:hypothetical protein